MMKVLVMEDFGGECGEFGGGRWWFRLVMVEEGGGLG
jgi:hypothetical protein